MNDPAGKSEPSVAAGAPTVATPATAMPAGEMTAITSPVVANPPSADSSVETRSTEPPSQRSSTSPSAESEPSRSEPAATASGSRGSQPVQLSSRPVTPVPIAWRVWPVVDSPAELVFLMVVIAATTFLANRFAGPLTAVTAGLVVAFVTWRQFVPTVFDLSALGVSESCLGRRRRIPWLSIDRFVIGKRGAYLSSADAPLELLRGLYLPWGSHREQIIATLRYYLPRAESVDE